MVKNLFIFLELYSKTSAGSDLDLARCCLSKATGRKRNSQSSHCWDNRGWEVHGAHSDLLENSETVQNVHVLESKIPFVFPAQFDIGTPKRSRAWPQCWQQEGQNKVHFSHLPTTLARVVAVLPSHPTGRGDRGHTGLPAKCQGQASEPTATTFASL